MQNSTDQPNTTQPKLLLSSLASFQSLIFPILEQSEAERVCEIGIGTGEFARLLVSWCEKRRCHYSGIDSTLESCLIEELSSPRVSFYKTKSLDTLTQIHPQDIYFIDGDHNYYTVYHELQQIFSKRHLPGLVFVHDVGWPWGRRDQYCDPEAIPAEFRHPYTFEGGVMPGRKQLQRFGFRGKESNYKYAIAHDEGGPRNGVMTALEDAMAGLIPADYEMLSIPSVFGLAVVFSKTRYADSLHPQVLQPLHDSIRQLQTHLETLESNRNELFLNFLQGHIYGKWLQHRLRNAEERIAKLQNENARLKKEINVLNNSVAG